MATERLQTSSHLKILYHLKVTQKITLETSPIQASYVLTLSLRRETELRRALEYQKLNLLVILRYNYRIPQPPNALG